MARKKLTKPVVEYVSVHFFGQQDPTGLCVSVLPVKQTAWYTTEPVVKYDETTGTIETGGAVFVPSA